MSHVPLTADRTHEFSPPALGTVIPGTDIKPASVIPHPEIKFFLRIPTWEDRDMISLRMYAHGVNDVTAEQIQSLVVSELYEIMPEDQADEAARFCEGFWLRQKQHQIDLQTWSEQEAIRRLDVMEAGTEFEATPQPPEVTTPRERARVNNLVSDVTDKSKRLRDKLVDQQLYNKRFGQVMARLQIAGWMGLKTEAAFETGHAVLDAPALTKATIEALRSELMEIDSTGAAWDELVAEAEAMFDLPRSAEKNLSSPPVSSSPPDGSTTTNTESGSSDGSSSSSEATSDQPKSSTEPTPGDTSPTTTGTSSASSPASGTATPKRGRTAKKSSTNPSA